jgi:hypothetical protein
MGRRTDPFTIGASVPLRTVCPCCLSENDYAAAADSAHFGPGAVTLCFRCGQWAVVADDRQLRRPTPDEVLAIVADVTALRIVEAWAASNVDRLAG